MVNRRRNEKIDKRDIGMMKKFFEKIFSINRMPDKISICIFGIKIHFGNKQRKLKEALLKISSNTESNSEYALALLINFIKKYGLNNVAYCLDVAVFAHKNGYKDEQIEKAVLIYNQIEENLKNKLIENYLKDKKVAVVGNGGCELGKGRGKELDSNDVVIRFNTYPSDYEEDYGKKCNIWFRGYGIEGYIKDRDWEQFDFVVCPILAKNYIPKYLFESFYQNIKKYPEKFSSLPSEFIKNLPKKYGVANPTNGFKALIYVKDCCSVLNLSIYGFSFLEEIGKENDFHYYDSMNISGHTVDDERRVLREVFKKS